jgi:hypothetical protein
MLRLPPGLWLLLLLLPKSFVIRRRRAMRLEGGAGKRREAWRVQRRGARNCRAECQRRDGAARLRPCASARSSFDQAPAARRRRPPSASASASTHSQHAPPRRLYPTAGSAARRP